MQASLSLGPCFKRKILWLFLQKPSMKNFLQKYWFTKNGPVRALHWLYQNSELTIPTTDIPLITRESRIKLRSIFWNLKLRKHICVFSFLKEDKTVYLCCNIGRINHWFTKWVNFNILSAIKICALTYIIRTQR